MIQYGKRIDWNGLSPRGIRRTRRAAKRRTSKARRRAMRRQVMGE